MSGVVFALVVSLLSLAIGDPALDAPKAELSIDATPVGNTSPTNEAMRVEGVTAQDSKREFLAEYGLTSNKGASASGPDRDKVTIYASVQADAGTGDVWVMNPLLRMSPDSGDYNAQGIELDFDNLNADRGNDSGAGGLAQPSAYGMAITGQGKFKSTAALGIMGITPKMWNRGLTCASDSVAQETIADYCNPEISISIAGKPEYGIKQVHSKTKNLLNGNTGVGFEPLDAFSLSVGNGVAFSGGLWMKGMSVEEHGTDDVLGMLGYDSPSTTLSQIRPLVSSDVNGSAIFGFDFTSVRKANLNLIRQANDEEFDEGINDKSNGDDGYVSVEGIISLLVEGFKEQQKVIDKLSSRIEELEHKSKLNQ